MLLQILHPGTYASIQDLGRFSARSFGVPVGGAADIYRHRIANLALGNEETAATIEIAGGGFRAKSLTGGCLAFSGSGNPWKINGVYMEKGRRIYVPPDALIEVPGPGNYHYLAVPGGWQVPDVLGSKSYCKAGQFGGGQGRGVQAGNFLAAPEPPAASLCTAKWYIAPDAANPVVKKDASGAIIIRILKGPEWDWWDATAHIAFLTEPFWISDRRDRMGVRLESVASFHHPDAGKMRSSGITIGAIQVPPDGQPFVLLADAQTTGGYPRMAQVVYVDIPILAQINSGQSLVFQFVEMAEAVRLRTEQEAFFRRFLWANTE